MGFAAYLYVYSKLSCHFWCAMVFLLEEKKGKEGNGGCIPVDVLQSLMIATSTDIEKCTFDMPILEYNITNP